MNNSLRTKKRINVSIAISLIWLFCIGQFFIFINFIEVDSLHSIIIMISETILCTAMWAFFIIKIDWLKDITTGKEITYLNISNVLSAIRFALVPLLITMFGLLKKSDAHFKFRILIFTFAVLICLTDLIDGMLARNLNQVTKLGMILDPIGDFLMIICFSILIFINKILAWWFFILIMIRIPGLIIIALILMAFNIKFKMKTTPLGKTTIFYTLTFLGVASIKLLLNFENHYYDTFLFIAQIIGSILIVASSTEKIIFLISYIKNQDKFSDDKIQFQGQ